MVAAVRKDFLKPLHLRPEMYPPHIRCWNWGWNPRAETGLPDDCGFMVNLTSFGLIQTYPIHLYQNQIQLKDPPR